MMKSFSLTVLESLAKSFGDTNQGFTGSEIGKLLYENGFPDPLVGATKWKRLYEAFREKQSQDKCANNIGAFIQDSMNPARHYNNSDWYSEIKYNLNQILSFEGLELGEDGKLRTTTKTSTISEAKSRARNLKNH